MKSKVQSPKSKVVAVHSTRREETLIQDGSKIQYPLSKIEYARWWMVLVLWFLAVGLSYGQTVDALFAKGTEAYLGGDYSAAARAFRESARLRPAGGTFQNLGNAEWQLGHTGEAVLAWEQSLWLDPFHGAAHTDLRFARKTAQLESPELAWYEVVSSWLPVNWWAWVAGVSFWFAVGMVMLPGIFRWRKVAWQQAFAAIGLAVFLLSVPAHIGVDSRSRIGFILQKNAPLRLTPTENAQYVTRLPAGEPARLDRMHGNYLLIRTSHSTGWVQRNQFGLTSAFRPNTSQHVPSDRGAMASSQ